MEKQIKERNKTMKQIEQTLTSLEVAEMVGKDHSKLLRDIRTYQDQLNEAKIGLGDFFTESSYKDLNNQIRPCYQVTKKGCEFIAHKLTGVRGTEFTAKYINRFHAMEEQIASKPKSPLELLEIEFEAIKEVDNKIDNVRKDLEDFKLDMPLLGTEIDKITTAVRKKGVQCLGGKDSNAYKDSSVRMKLYADIYAVLKSTFDVTTYKAIKRGQTNEAVKVIQSYKPTEVLKEVIRAFNRG